MGVDLQPAAVEYANRSFRAWNRRGGVRAIVADIRRLHRALPTGQRFGFAFCPHNSIRHLPTEEDLAQHLRAVSRVLASRGVYAVGLGLQPIDGPIAGEDVHQAARGRTRVTGVFEYFEAPRVRGQPRRERVVSFTTVRRGRAIAEHASHYDLLCVDPAMWARCLRRAGFEEIGVVDDETARDLPPDRAAYAYRVIRPKRGASLPVAALGHARRGS